MYPHCHSMRTEFYEWNKIELNFYLLFILIGSDICYFCPTLTCAAPSSVSQCSSIIFCQLPFTNSLALSEENNQNPSQDATEVLWCKPTTDSINSSQLQSNYTFWNFVPTCYFKVMLAGTIVTFQQMASSSPLSHSPNAEHFSVLKGRFVLKATWLQQHLKSAV